MDLATFVSMRGVDDPCTQCRGLGTRMYGSTSTWRGGLGGAAMTTDVCNACWGSGDAHRPWADLSKLRDEETRRVKARAATYLGNALGANIVSLHPAIEEVCKVLDKEGRRRKVPLGSDFFAHHNWGLVTTGLAKVLRGLLVAKPDTESQTGESESERAC